MKSTNCWVVIAGLTLSGSPALADTIVVSCGAVGAELEACKQGAAAWEKKTGHTVKIVPSPNDSTERLALYQQILSSKAPDLDVFSVDVVWPGMIGHHLVDLSKKVNEKTRGEHFQAFMQNNVVEGKLTAMPLYVDAGLLYFRKDLLEKHKQGVPKTWEELTSAARTVQENERKAGNKDIWGYVFQGRAYEGLTCNALEWFESHDAGSIVSQDGKVTINNPSAVKALALAASWIGSISPKGVLNYSEEEARGVFQSGKAVFMRSWPYVWGLANSKDSPIKGKVGVTLLPKGSQEGKNAATLGGWSMAVSKYSKNQDLAADFVLHMAGRDEQKRRAIDFSYNPTLTELYKDKDVLKANPFLADLHDAFANAVARPSRIAGQKYNRLSAETWDTVHKTLSGNGEPSKNLAALESKLKRMSRGGKW